jgi:hypothetical protein
MSTEFGRGFPQEFHADKDGGLLGAG